MGANILRDDDPRGGRLTGVHVIPIVVHLMHEGGAPRAHYSSKRLYKGLYMSTREAGIYRKSSNYR
jgi:hypothetical protein